MFFQSNDFEFTTLLETNWLVIKKELENLRSSHFMPWPEKHLYEKGWDVFGLYAFNQKIQRNCELCPKTTKLVEQIPGMITAGFSSLARGTHIKPHTGYASSVLRTHLGLIVPDDCAIRVGDRTQQWEEGKCLIFDDHFEHEAWNRSTKTRIVLLLDFRKPDEDSNSRIVCSQKVVEALHQLTYS